MDLHQYLIAIRKRWIAVVALVIVGGALGYFMAAQMTPVYRSTSSLFISARQGDNTSELLQGSTFAQNVVQSYAALATTDSVLEPAMRAVHYEGTIGSFSSRITSDTPINTVIINISAEDTDPATAQKYAAAVTTSLASAISEIAPQTSAHQPAITTSVIATATLPRVPISPNKTLSTLLGLGAGLALGLTYAVTRHLLDTRVRTSDDIQSIAELPVLGRIPRGRRRTDPLTVLAAPGSADAEAYRSLVSNLEFADLDRSIRVVVVSSPSVNDGKSTVSINLALAMAERTNRVLLVDADLRRPSIAGICQIEGSVGLTSVLLGRATLSEAVQQWGSANLDVLAAGTLPSNPSQLFSSAAFSDLVRTMAAEYDFVVFDSVPLLTVADTLPLSRLTDGVLVTVRYNGTKRHDLRLSLESLQRVNAPVLGAVINFVPAAPRTPYNSYVTPSPSVPRPSASVRRSTPLARGERATRLEADGDPRSARHEPEPEPEHEPEALASLSYSAAESGSEDETRENTVSSGRN